MTNVVLVWKGPANLHRLTHPVGSKYRLLGKRNRQRSYGSKHRSICRTFDYLLWLCTCRYLWRRGWLVPARRELLPIRFPPQRGYKLCRWRWHCLVPHPEVLRALATVLPKLFGNTPKLHHYHRTMSCSDRPTDHRLFHFGSFATLAMNMRTSFKHGRSPNGSFGSMRPRWVMRLFLCALGFLATSGLASTNLDGLCYSVSLSWLVSQAGR
jgi:hypothetical protein